MAIAARQSWPPQQRKRASRLVQRQLIERFSGTHDAWLIYRATPLEVDTASLMAQPGIRAFAPVTLASGDMRWLKVDADTSWRLGRHGIEEPAGGEVWQPSGPVLVACPLVGFDRHGNRLGMGMGCYDRWLAEHRADVACLVGLAFSCQELSDIPRERHDVPMDYVVTEKEIIACADAVGALDGARP